MMVYQASSFVADHYKADSVGGTVFISFLCMFMYVGCVFVWVGWDFGEDGFFFLVFFVYV